MISDDNPSKSIIGGFIKHNKDLPSASGWVNVLSKYEHLDRVVNSGFINFCSKTRY
jgi:hypothetical protein